MFKLTKRRIIIYIVAIAFIAFVTTKSCQSGFSEISMRDYQELQEKIAKEPDMILLFDELYIDRKINVEELGKLRKKFIDLQLRRVKNDMEQKINSARKKK